MPGPKGSPNKVAAEVKAQLQNFIDAVKNRMNIENLAIYYQGTMKQYLPSNHQTFQNQFCI